MSAKSLVACLSFGVVDGTSFQRVCPGDCNKRHYSEQSLYFEDCMLDSIRLCKAFVFFVGGEGADCARVDTLL